MSSASLSKPLSSGLSRTLSPGSAASPLVVDTVVDWEASSEGTEITDAIMATATEGDDFDEWFTCSAPDAFTSGATPNLEIKTGDQAPEKLFQIGATPYQGGTRKMRVDMASLGVVHLPTDVSGGYDGPALSIGFHFKWNGAGINQSPRDIVRMFDKIGGFQVFQVVDNHLGDPKFRAHWQPTAGSNTGPEVDIEKGVWYWVTMHWALGGETHRVQVYNAATEALVGESTGDVSGASTTGCNIIQVGMGQYPFSGQTVDIDNFVIKRDGAFPLI